MISFIAAGPSRSDNAWASSLLSVGTVMTAPGTRRSGDPGFHARSGPNRWKTIGVCSPTHAP